MNTPHYVARVIQVQDSEWELASKIKIACEDFKDKNVILCPVYHDTMFENNQKKL